MNAREPASAAVRAIGRQVIDRIVVPKDHWEIAAQLEVMGIRDEDARSDFHCRDTFDLAEQILAQFNAGAFPLEREEREGKEERSRFLRFLRDYANGLMFSLPIAVQALAMLLRGYGVWGAVSLDARTSTAMGIGVLASYAVTGGFCQTIVRRGLFYISQEEDYLARATVLRIWMLSVAFVLALTIPLLLFNALYGFLPWDMTGLVIFYYVALSILWLNFSLIYLARKSYLFVVVIIVALIAAIVSREVFGASIIISNAVALFVADVASFAASMEMLRRRINRRQATRIATVPRLTILVYSTALFFFYGALYNVFLFTDRVNAWTSARGRADYLPYAIWVDGPYELGMDLALIVIVLLMGVVEHVTQRFSGRLIANQEAVQSSASDAFNRESLRFYWSRVAMFAVAAVAAVIVSFVALSALRYFAAFPVLTNPVAVPVIMRVFWIAAISYVFLMLALQNVLMLLSLSRVNLVLKAVAPALVVNIIVGFFCSRALHYSLAVAGLLAGAIVFAVVSTAIAHRVMSTLDYHYYAAY